MLLDKILGSLLAFLGRGLLQPKPQSWGQSWETTGFFHWILRRSCSLNIAYNCIKRRENWNCSSCPQPMGAPHVHAKIRVSLASSSSTVLGCGLRRNFSNKKDGFSFSLSRFVFFAQQHVLYSPNKSSVGFCWLNKILGSWQLDSQFLLSEELEVFLVVMWTSFPSSPVWRYPFRITSCTLWSTYKLNVSSFPVLVDWVGTLLDTCLSGNKFIFSGKKACFVCFCCLHVLWLSETYFVTKRPSSQFLSKINGPRSNVMSVRKLAIFLIASFCWNFIFHQLPLVLWVLRMSQLLPRNPHM